LGGRCSFVSGNKMSSKNYGAALAVAICCAASAVQAEIDEIVVTASPLAGDKVAVPASQLDQNQLDAKGGGSLGEMLDGELGVAQSGFATGASRPIIRGLDNFRVRLQENGVSSQGVSAVSEDHGAPLDPLSADRVEVLRGPAVLRYGSQAIGGVVTILNERIPDTMPDAGLSGQAYGALSSVDNGRQASMSVTGGAASIALHADGFVRRFEDYDLPDSGASQRDTFLRSEGFTFGASHIADAGHVGVSFGRLNSLYGVPAAASRLFIDMRQDKVNFAGAYNDLTIDIGWSDYIHHEVDKATGDIGSTFRNEEWEGRAEYLMTLDNGADGAVGVQASGRDLDASGEGGELLAPVKSETLALFGFYEAPLTARFSLQGGARVELARHDGFGVTTPQLDGATLGQPIDNFGAQRQRDYTLTSGSAAVLFAPDDTRLFSIGLNYAERAPAAPELFSKGPHEATETFEIGDPTLSEERALSVEAHAELDQGDRQVTVNLFYTAFDGFIHKRFTGFVCGDDFSTCGAAGAPGVDDELTQVQFAQEDARFYGAEAAVTQWLGTAHGLQIGVEGRFDMVRAKLDQGGNVPRITPMRLGGGLLVEGDTISAALRMTRTFKQTRVGENETPTKGFNNLAAQIAYRPSGFSDLTIGLVGQNLADDVGRNHVSFKKDGVVQPGRNIRFYVRTGF